MSIQYKDRSWLIMQCLKDFGPQSREQLTSHGSNEEAKEAIAKLTQARLIATVEGGLVDLTLTGSRKLRQLNSDSSELEVVGKRTLTTGTATGFYEGEELRRTCLRPGAYDAFELPSLMAGQRFYRREIRA